eukprot:CAMPEP_0118687202 /NCGR_PEP_ID=MMETSP0800-20121206/8248_1 /TAXON_ID=210618 ORGANISM="Striatella unipunctata, Strain CCMP2910" /NCGR_SAMPLE_ID=MMETSP0800 /ASSEMBLY_ACC=CAM_ASM_000638 /LENGTH=670 /DNA_ID=CAMNT_0006584353 /DNA_START=25 /DNA_END=2034 /DNA_ORIENTATION=-
MHKQKLAVDIVVGGPPCSDHAAVNAYAEGLKSSSGKKLLQLAELINKIQKSDKQEGRALFFVAENTYLTNKDTIHEVERAYDIPSVELDAKYFSLCKRKRNYWTNIPINTVDYDSISAEASLAHGFCIEEGWHHCASLTGKNNVLVLKANTFMASHGRLDDERMRKAKVLGGSAEKRYILGTWSVSEREKMMGFPTDYVKKTVSDLFEKLSQLLLMKRIVECNWKQDEEVMRKYYKAFSGLRFFINPSPNPPFIEVALPLPNQKERTTSLVYNCDEYSKRVIGNSFSVPVMCHLLRPLQELFQERSYKGYDYPFPWPPESCNNPVVVAPAKDSAQTEEVTLGHQNEKELVQTEERTIGHQNEEEHEQTEEEPFQIEEGTIGNQTEEELFQTEEGTIGNQNEEEHEQPEEELVQTGEEPPQTEDEPAQMGEETLETEGHVFEEEAAYLLEEDEAEIPFDNSETPFGDSRSNLDEVEGPHEESGLLLEATTLEPEGANEQPSEGELEEKEFEEEEKAEKDKNDDNKDCNDIEEHDKEEQMEVEEDSLHTIPPKLNILLGPNEEDGDDVEEQENNKTGKEDEMEEELEEDDDTHSIPNDTVIRLGMEPPRISIPYKKPRKATIALKDRNDMLPAIIARADDFDEACLLYQFGYMLDSDEDDLSDGENPYGPVW